MSLILEDSVAMHFSEIIDCRYLTIALEYRDLEQPAAKMLALELLDFMTEQIDDYFVAQWHIDNRSIGRKNLRKKIEEALDAGVCYSYVSAYNKSAEISTQQQFREWHSYLRRSASLTVRPLSGLSLDYVEYWNQLIYPHAHDKTALKQAFIQLFRESGRYLRGVCWSADVEGFLFHNTLDVSNDHLNRFGFSVSAFALKDQLEVTADKWKKKLISLSEKYVSLNGRIMLQPRSFHQSSPYMDYFVSQPKDIEDMLPGVEWVNVISPQTQEWLPEDIVAVAQNADVQCSVLNGGGLLIGSPKTIRDYDVEDAVQLKMLLKDSLFPGQCSGYPLQVIMRPLTVRSLCNHPRKNWAIVPILEDEIHIVGSTLYFQTDFD